MRAVRRLVAALCLGTLAGCADDVTLRDPRSGEVAVCEEPTRGFNPWSQTDACVTDRLAQGWVLIGEGGDGYVDRARANATALRDR